MEVVTASVSPTTERRAKLKRRYGLFMAATALLSLGTSESVDYPELPRDVEIVGMGDSYTSGHANGEVKDRYNDCFYSDINYVDVLAKWLDVENVNNVACSGASIEDIEQGRFDQPSQLEALSPTTDYVFLTAGANVVNVSEFFSQCLHEGCATDGEVFTQVISKVRSAEFRKELVDLYLSITDNAPNGKLIVVPYAELISEKSLWWSQKLLGDDLPLELIMTFQDELNQVIAEAVAEAKAQSNRITLAPVTKNADAIGNFGQTVFLDPNTPRSMGHFTAAGHEIIARESALAGLNIAQLDKPMDVSRLPKMLWQKNP